MIRTLWVVLSACCVALVVSEALGVGFLWSQGLLSVRRIREVRDLLVPQEKEAVAKQSESQTPLPSAQDVLRERSMRVLGLNSLETEVGLLKAMLETERANLSAQNADFQKDKNAFKTQLLQLADQNLVAAREQARAILLALPPAEAVDRLMQLSVEEDVLLMREMPEAKIALILKEFAPAAEEGGGGAANATANKENSRAQRAKEIFEHITKGEPRESIIRSALNKVQQTEPERTTANP
jgi:hypothetical protein